MRIDPLRRHERRELLDTLRGVGPDAPTLCARWSAGDIAAHLVTTEALGGVPMVVGNQLRRVLPVGVTRRGIRAMQARGDTLIARARARGWPSLLAQLEAGPPRLFASGTLADLRLVEEWVHHEDVRRANGQPPRVGSQALDDALWAAGLTVATFPEFLPGRAGLEVALPDGRSHTIGSAPTVRVAGRPGEVLLYLAGRGDAAEVTVDGDRSVIARLELTV